MGENHSPEKIFCEYEAGVNYKASLGDKGLYEQNKINERFYAGDQWRGARCGNDRPLVRYNVIRRIGDYKISMISSSPLAVNYSADGVPNTLDIKKRVEFLRNAVMDGHPLTDEEVEGQPGSKTVPCDEEVTLIMSALSSASRGTWGSGCTRLPNFPGISGRTASTATPSSPISSPTRSPSTV